MAGRTIFDHDPDPVRLFDELYFQGARDFRGLPLGDVAGHARRRYTACYGVLCLARMLTGLGRIGTAAALDVVGAQFQDKRTSVEFPAAHVLPCDLMLALPGYPLPGAPLYHPDLLRNPVNRFLTQCDIFGRTDRVHRLVNVADRSCEAGPDGMALALAAACDEVIKDGLLAWTLVPAGSRTPIAPSVRFRFETMLVPAFAAVAAARLRALDASLTAYERDEMRRGRAVNTDGSQLVARPTDTRLSSHNVEARAAARIALRQVLQVYAAPGLIDTQELMAMAGYIDALRLNEADF
jgi:hypothetical protein